MDLAAVVRLAQAQHNLVRRDQASEIGLSWSGWYRANAGGLFEPVHPRVSRLGGSLATADQCIAAAVMSVGRGAMASHRSAAYLWGAAPIGDGPVDVLVPKRARQPTLERVALHRPTDLGDLRPVARSGIPATNPIRTVLDLGAVADVPTVGSVLEHFPIRKSFGLPTLRAAMRRHAQHGRGGIGALRLLLHDWALGDKPPDSVLEPRFARLLREYGLPPAAFHHVVRLEGKVFELDFAFVDQRLDVEIDGWASHGGSSAFGADRDRDAYLVGHGWRVLRMTWFRVSHDPKWVAERVRESLAHARGG